MTPSAPQFRSDDEAAEYWLIVLRDGDEGQRLTAREELATIFERRGMLEEATDLLISNIRDGVRHADIFRWLARLYRSQGQEVLALQAAAEAAKYMPQTAIPETGLMVTPQPSSAPGSDKLEEMIRRYTVGGYRVVNQTTTTAQLVKPKEFSAIWAVLWFLVFGFGVLVYIFYYMGKRDTIVHLSLNAEGGLRIQSSDQSLVRGLWLCPPCGSVNTMSQPVCKRKSCRLPRLSAAPPPPPPPPTGRPGGFLALLNGLALIGAGLIVIALVLVAVLAMTRPTGLIHAAPAPTAVPAPITAAERRTVRCDMIIWHSRDDLAAAVDRAGREGSQVMAKAAADALAAGRATLLKDGDRVAPIDGSATPPAVKVEVLDGPYKGQTGWTIRADCLR
jgi:hypothetical protein